MLWKLKNLKCFSHSFKFVTSNLTEELATSDKILMKEVEDILPKKEEAALCSLCVLIFYETLIFYGFLHNPKNKYLMNSRG